MARVRGWLESWPLFLLSALWLALLAAVHLWPASWWLDVRSVRISDAAHGDSPAMLVERTISREFKGTWQITVRRWDGGWVVWCNASGTSNYKPSASLPPALTLRWWTDGQCHPLDAGKYTVTTTWTILGHGLAPDRLIKIDSNIFEVRP